MSSPSAQPLGQPHFFRLVYVVRYSALVLGIGYGILHRNTLQERLDNSTASAELKKREHWVQEAQKAWKSRSTQTVGVVSDPDSPNFDLEVFLKSLEK